MVSGCHLSGRTAAENQIMLFTTYHRLPAVLADTTETARIDAGDTALHQSFVDAARNVADSHREPVVFIDAWGHVRHLVRPSNA